MKLSLCIPAYNEEKNIHYPLGSAYDLADEVIVIDPGSTDRTAEIAKSYGSKVKIFKTDNPRNFLINKQRAIERASGEWILQLDADEALSEELKNEIRYLLFVNRKNPNNQYPITNNVGFYIPRKNWFLTRFLMKGGLYPDYVLRLYKKEKGRFNLKDLHENVEIDGPVGYLKNPILHYADPNFSRYLLRWDRYTTFDAETAIKEGKKLNFFSYFCIKPKVWFLKSYFRHKGFMDGFPGFVFSLFSSIRFWVIYIKYWQLKQKKL